MRIALLADTSSIHARRWIESMAREKVLVASPTSEKIVGTEHFFYHQARPAFGLQRTANRLLSSLLIVIALLTNNPKITRWAIKKLSGLGFASLDIVNKILNFKPDVIHLHYLSRLDDSLALLLLPRDKIIISTWGDDVEEQAGKHSFLVKILRRKVLKRAQLVTATSGYLAELTFKYSNHQVFPWLIPFGVDTKLFHPVPRKTSKNVLVFVKPTWPVYGSDTLLKVLRRLNNGRLKFELWIIGQETEEFRQEARRLRLEKEIRYLGTITNKEVAKVIPKATLMILPSRFESFGVSAVEAQACGVPVVASEVGGLPEVVQHKQTGILVAPADIEEFVKAIKDVAKNRDQYSSRARNWAVERYSWNKAVTRMNDHYREVISPKKQVAMTLTNSVRHDNRVKKEAQSLTDSGYRVTIFGMLEPEERMPLWEMIGDVRVIRTPKDVNLSAGGVKGLLKKSLHLPEILIYGGASLRKLHGVVSNFRANVFHAHDLDTLLVATLAAGKWRSKLVYDSHELFIAAMTDSINEKVRNKRILHLVIMLLIRLNLSIIERLFIGKANAVITVSDSISKYLFDKYTLKSRPTVILNAWEKALTPTQKDIFRKILNLKQNKTITLHQGGIIEGRGLESLVESVPNFPKNVVLVFLGYGKLVPHLKSLVKKKKIADRVFFLDAVPAKELMNYTSSADIGVITLEATNLNNIYAMPNKLFEYLSAGLAIVVPDYPDMSEVVKKGAGVTFKHGNWKDLVDKVKLVSQKEVMLRMKKTSMTLFETEYNWEREKKKLADLYGEVLNEDTTRTR